MRDELMQRKMQMLARNGQPAEANQQQALASANVVFRGLQEDRLEAQPCTDRTCLRYRSCLIVILGRCAAGLLHPEKVQACHPAGRIAGAQFDLDLLAVDSSRYPQGRTAMWTRAISNKACSRPQPISRSWPIPIRISASMTQVIALFPRVPGPPISTIPWAAIPPPSWASTRT